MTKMAEHPISILPHDAVLLEYLDASPAQVAASWPVDQPLLALIGNGGHSKW